jgi:hypothetical protein
METHCFGLIRNNLTATTGMIERAIFNDNECLCVFALADEPLQIGFISSVILTE